MPECSGRRRIACMRCANLVDAQSPGGGDPPPNRVARRQACAQGQGVHLVRAGQAMRFFKSQSAKPETHAPDNGAAPKPGDDRNGREQLLAALLIDAVHHRALIGELTTLRDLHSLLDVPQPVALRVAHQLQKNGIALIEANMSDAFASVITIAPAIREQIRKGERSSPDLKPQPKS